MISTSGPTRGRRAELLGLALVLAVSQLHAAWFGHICDDAYISFRYAYDLAHGAGLAFNPGERVMGYSNLLWVLALAAFERMGISSVTAAVGLGSLCSLLLLALLFPPPARLVPIALARPHGRAFSRGE